MYPIDLEEYEEFVDATANYPIVGRSDFDYLAYPTLGLVGEAGEFANKVKKIDRDDDGLLTLECRVALISELGDVLWYITRLAHILGCNLTDIAKANQAKLTDRQERGVLSGSGDNR